MAEYFDKVTDHYLFHLNKDCNNYKVKLEILSSYETVIGEIIKDLSITAAGQININYQQLTRRSCSITLINVDGKYNPNQNRWFWINRKFKLWIGMQSHEDIYWFSQGVYYATSVNGDGHTISVEGVDKGGALDGTLKLNMLEVQHIIEVGDTISMLIKNTLGMNDGVQIVDARKPLIDNFFDGQTIQQEISLNANEYLGTLFTNICDSYGADIWYDGDGRMNVWRKPAENYVDGYEKLPVIYHFDDTNANYSQSTINYDYDVVNAVTVFTNANVDTSTEGYEDFENVSYTAYNRNPKSPINIRAIGVRRMEDAEINYIDTLDKQQMTERCRQYANYLLLKESLLQNSISFSSIIVPHLDVNNVVRITDKAKGIDGEKFVVQSITIPLSADEMQIEATSINVLPHGTDMEMG